MSLITDEEAIVVFAKGMLDLITINSDGRIEGCDAVGIYIRIDQDKKAYLIKYDLNNKEFGIIKAKYKSALKNGTILYYHDDKGDTVTQAALYGDQIVEEDYLE